MKKLLYGLLKWSARSAVKRHKPYVIGITGSVGKTSCRMVVAQTLQQLLPDVRISTSPKNFNSEIGLCLSILEITYWSTQWYVVVWVTFLAVFRGLFGAKKYDVLVAEYGIDNFGDMDYLVSIVTPDIGIFTVLDKVHALQLGTPDEIIAEKSKLFPAMRDVLFVSNQAVSYTREFTKDITADLLTYALTDTETKTPDIYWENREIISDEEGLPYSRCLIEQGEDRVWNVTTNLLSQSDIGYIALSIEIGMIISLRLKKPLIAEENSDKTVHLDYHLQPGRMTLFEGQYGSILVDSSYNGAPQSMKSMIDMMILLRNSTYRGFDLIYCIGDMRELGDFSEQEHRKLAGIVAQSADAVFLVGQETNAYMIDELKKVGFNPEEIFWSGSSQEIGELLAMHIPNRQNRSLILFKGSQNTIFVEESIKPLLKNSEDHGKLPRQDGFWKKKKTQAGLVMMLCCAFLLSGCGVSGGANQDTAQLSGSVQVEQQVGEQNEQQPIEQLDQGTEAVISTVCITDRCFSVEIADSPLLRQRGLMWRESLADDAGMLFIFDQPGYHRFWMKNTLIPLDMIWIDQQQRIVAIENDVQPCPASETICPSYGPQQGTMAQYVLEIGAGFAEQYGFTVGMDVGF